MEKDFTKHNQSLALKELGFDEPCLAYYQKSAVIGDDTILPIQIRNKASNFNDNEYSKMCVPFCSAPLYQQAFRWFREKYGLNSQIAFCEYAIESCNSWKYTFDNPTRQYWNGNFNTYEQAESACLDKLIEIVKNK